jgi:hypothetical protein
MRTRIGVVIALVVGTAVLGAGSAEAKGPSGGTISGPGIDDPRRFDLDSATARLMEEAGFMYALFAQTPDPMLVEQPPGALGPRYALAWELPGPDATVDVVVQDLYPYAERGPLLYTDPGATFYGTETAHGGWFQAPDRLVTTLQSLGLPAAEVASGEARDARAVAAVPVADRRGSGSDPPWLGIGASLVVVIAAVVVVHRVRRRAAVVPPG